MLAFPVCPQPLFKGVDCVFHHHVRTLSEQVSRHRQEFPVERATVAAWWGGRFRCSGHVRSFCRFLLTTSMVGWLEKRVRVLLTEYCVLTRAGNGAAMRVAPLVCLAWAMHGGKEGDLRSATVALTQLVIQSSMMTHTSLLGISPTFALAYLLLEVLHWSYGGRDGKVFQEPPLSAHEQLALLSELVEDFESKLWDCPEYGPFRFSHPLCTWSPLGGGREFFVLTVVMHIHPLVPRIMRGREK